MRTGSGPDPGLNVNGSELGHLFYNELGGVASQSITTTHNANYDLFTNIQSPAYWFSTEVSPGSPTAWSFGTLNGFQGNLAIKDSPHYASAGRTGDVAAVPVPAAIWLFGSSLAGLVGIGRRKRH